MPSAPQITTQPVDYVGLVGDMATFTVVAEGEGLTYQWYDYDTEAAEWKKSSNGTTEWVFAEKVTGPVKTVLILIGRYDNDGKRTGRSK